MSKDKDRDNIISELIYYPFYSELDDDMINELVNTLSTVLKDNTDEKTFKSLIRVCSDLWNEGYIKGSTDTAEQVPWG